ncbi:MAG: sulfur carrier protein ThiS [Planctomycetes bacterium]|nr:sulfur carrier protein ThiS [Planctomycetota bacterium]
MKLKVNGGEREVPEGTTLSALLESLGVNPARVAVERNLDIVPKAAYQSLVLESGDEFEIVSYVGGGCASC